MAVPVVAKSGKVLGGLFMGHSEPGIFTEPAEKIVAGLAAQAAIAVDNATLYKELQESIRARDEFLSIASHELKTPLTNLTLQAQLRKRILQKNGTSAFPPKKFKQMFDTDERQLTRLNRLIDDMLDIARISTGKLQIQKERVDLAAVAREVVARNRQALDDQGIEAKLTGAAQAD